MSARYEFGVEFAVTTSREDDGRVIAEVPAIAGCLAYGATAVEATSRATALALRVIAERVEAGEAWGVGDELEEVTA